VTGWYANGARDLIPAEGRFAERDPLGFASGDPNLYRYLGNNPVNATDPNGTQANKEREAYLKDEAPKVKGVTRVALRRILLI
jgi:uncharacterized protein RhaS with RHS repeats